MNHFSGNIETLTNKNKNYRKVLYTSNNVQLVMMNLKPNEEIGMEIHKKIDQFIRIEKGTGVAIIDGHQHKLTDGSALIIPMNTKHNIINTSKTKHMTLYTIYSPPEHKDGLIQKIKPKE